MTPKKRNQDYYLNDIPLEDAIKSYFDSLSKKNSFAKKIVGEFERFVFR